MLMKCWRLQSSFAYLCLGLFLLVCGDLQSASSQPSSDPMTTGAVKIVPEAENADSDVITRIERGDAYVEWRASAKDKSRVAIILGGTNNAPAMIDLDTAESLSPIELFIALTPAETSVPDRLLRLAKAKDEALMKSKEDMSALRARIEQDRVRLVKQLTSNTESQAMAYQCTAAERTTARVFYGRGYTSGTTCGESLGFLDASRTYWYCIEGDCDYTLNNGSPSCGLDFINTDCDAIRGDVKSQILRSVTHGNPHFLSAGHRIRAFAYNCHNNGNLKMRVRYGPGGWDHVIPVPPNHHTGFLVVGHYLPETREAIWNASNGHWNDDVPSSGKTYQPTEYNIDDNTAPGDFGIFCSDVMKSMEMNPGGLPSNCNHPIGSSWCLSYCGGCFDPN